MIYDALEWVANHAASVGLALFVTGIAIMAAWDHWAYRRAGR